MSGHPSDPAFAADRAIADAYGMDAVPPMLRRAVEEKMRRIPMLPQGSAERKNFPMATGLIDYFPAALAYVALISKLGNDKHNPGQPLHHSRAKSSDHADCIVRHTADRGSFDATAACPDFPEGVRHSGCLAWRALALLQEELEREEGAPLARGAKL